MLFKCFYINKYLILILLQKLKQKDIKQAINCNINMTLMIKKQFFNNCLHKKHDINIDINN